MLKKWDVAPAPNERNSGRHKLLIKGEMKDIFLIIKKLGSLCSRPEKTSGEFDFIIYLSKLEVDTLKKLKAITSELSAPAPAGEAADAFGEEPAPFDSPRPRLKTGPAPAAEHTIQQPAPKPVEQPKPAAQPAPAAAQPPAESPSVIRPKGNFVPSAATRAKKEEAPAPAPAAPAPAAPSISSRIKTRWSMELPLIPTYSFQTLVAGSHNRFAHAAAMAVVENPGVIYNPLVVFGVPGTGKTHFVNSISRGLSASIGQSSIFVTDGIKFSKGVELAIKEGGVARLEEFLDKVKVLIIDDVHLLMVSEANKKYLPKWLNDFVAQNKQIVVTSVFPPKSLSGLEDAVGFQFTQGWIVDLKMPQAQAYKSILNQLMQGLDVKLSDEEADKFFAGALTPFNEVRKTLENMKKLEKFMINAMSNVSHAQLLDMLLGLDEAPADSAVTEEDTHHVSVWQPSQLDSAWSKWGLFHPRAMRREADFALFTLHERAKELGLNPDWSQIFIEEYDSDELYGIPFKIGNFASERNVNGVIVLGPQPTSALGAQEAEFRYITFKILDSLLVKSAWLPCERLKSRAAYAKILMDLA